MVWGMISSRGVSDLFIVQGMMNQGRYKEVLENVMLPQMEHWFDKGENPIFQQDSAPCHTAKSIKQFLTEKNIPILKWPGNSPDLNPIENVWEVLKREVAKTHITNKADLISKLKEVWATPYIKDVAKKCIDSMCRRVEAVKTAKGANTKY